MAHQWLIGLYIRFTRVPFSIFLLSDPGNICCIKREIYTECPDWIVQLARIMQTFRLGWYIFLFFINCSFFEKWPADFCYRNNGENCPKVTLFRLIDDDIFHIFDQIKVDEWCRCKLSLITTFWMKGKFKLKSRQSL